MAAVIDSSIGLAKETTFKTYAAPTRHYEFNSESLKWTKDVKSGRGIRVGSRVPRSARRAVATAEGAGDITVDVMTRGMGRLWEAGFGQGTSTAIPAAAGEFQQVFTIADTLPSYTVQKGVVRSNGTVDPYTFLGCTCAGFEIDSPNSEIVTAKFMWDIADLTTAQSYTTPVYPTDGDLVRFENIAVAVGGTITAPTSTALASSSGALTLCVRDFNLQVTSNLDNKRFCYGNGGRKGQQVATTRSIKGKFSAEYSATNLRDAFLNDTDVSILFTFTGASMGVNAEVLQIVLPVTKLDGDIPEANNDGIVVVDHSFEVFDGLVQAPITLVARTRDTAL